MSDKMRAMGNLNVSRTQRVAPERQALTVDMVEQELIARLRFLSNGGNMRALREGLINKITTRLSSFRDLYSPKGEYDRTEILKEAMVHYPSEGRETLVKISKDIAESPFGIFRGVLALPISDIFIVEDRISFSSGNSEAAREILIPADCRLAYRRMVGDFILITEYASKLSTTKFDPANAILDYTTNEIRFNVVHEALSASLSPAPTISIRKQLVRSDKGNALADIDSYLASVGLAGGRLSFVNHLATSGSFCVFGETGSGKTTLLKYMGNYKIGEKRNLITIEDTPELFLDTNIHYLTNSSFSIHDLFKVSLRENPSHMIIGETRSEEIVDILESALVFRCGTSIHADSLEKAILRIIFMVKAARGSYSSDDINSLISSTIDGFIYMKDRRVVEVWRRKSSFRENMTDALANYELVHDSPIS